MSVFGSLDLLNPSVVPLLPSPLVSWIGMRVSWAIVLANIAIQFSYKLNMNVRRWIALLAVVYAITPSSFSITYWLGLAFQSPSIASVLLSSAFLYKGLMFNKAEDKEDTSEFEIWLNIQVATIILIGYILLLDTFAIFPFQMYRFGFGQVSLLVVALIAFINLLVCEIKFSKTSGILIVFGVFIFVATRLPTGNVWDAILDPWLWVFLQVSLFRTFAKTFLK